MRHPPRRPPAGRRLAPLLVALCVAGAGVGVATALSITPDDLAADADLPAARAQRGSAPGDGEGDPAARVDHPPALLTAEDDAAPAAEDDATEDDAAPAAEDDAAEDTARAVPLRPYTEYEADHSLSGRRRSRLAFKRKEAEVEALFADAGLRFPPRQLLLRVFKREHVLEVWAAPRVGAPMTHVVDYQICALSGVPGPKRQEGDLQVPEGFYTLDLYHRRSRFYLSMRVDYPNRSDAVLGRRPLGHSIMIHGDCASVGCVAMTDERIEELWVMAKRVHDRGQPVAVHLFPQRDMDGLIAGTTDATLRPFWENLREGLRAFERDRVLPRVSVDRRSGRYRFR